MCRPTVGVVGVASPSLSVPPETAIGDATHLLVFASSALAEQRTPRAAEITDTESRVSGISFTDLDLDMQDLSGDVSWLQPTSRDFVSTYVIYLAFDPVGSGRSQLNEVPLDTNLITIPPDTKSGNRQFLLVYAKSVLAEQTTPASFAISDVVAMASNVTFEDFDLDASDIGGNLTWVAAENEAYVQHYVVYLAISCNISNSSEAATLLSGSAALTVEGPLQSSGA
ncbi:unnamed protein product [Symbiodinium natans]|uniref:Uncharacterized protein n=1 Tax=Symbiodinium natans TaxID=878477 RepID=A0A812G3K9_9DINO|nr:unnamed protein product [Symbiodinium natans]